MTDTMPDVRTRPRLRDAADTRPPCQQWQAPAPPVAQPALLLDLDLPAPTWVGLPAGGPGSTPGPSPTPRTARDVHRWSASLATAIVQVVQGQRPLSQLTRWIDERALAELALRRRQTGRGSRVGQPAVLRSVRTQHPDPTVTEVCAHLGLGRRSVPLAFRLELLGERWLCTALELGPLPSTPQQ